MTETMGTKNAYDMSDIRWTPMISLSFLIHAAIFLFIIYMPDISSCGRVQNRDIYEVNLVEIPENLLKEKPAANPVTNDSVNTQKTETRAKKIAAPVKTKDTRTIAKRTVDRKKSEPEKPEISSSQMIDRAISRIEKKVQPEDTGKDYIEEAISKLENQAPSNGSRAGKKDASSDGIIIRLYQARVESWIKSNWSYPVAVSSRKRLEAIINLKVKQNGTIVESLFTRRSGDNIFDQSVMKAVEKSNPLPPFPEGYRKTYEEFEINFNLKDLDKN